MLSDFLMFDSIRPISIVFVLNAFAFVQTSCAQSGQQTRSKTDVANSVSLKVTDEDWATYNHDPQGWRFNKAESSLTPETAKRLVAKWQFPRKGSRDKIGVIHGTPSVVNGYVYFGTATYPAFYKLRPDGELEWMYNLSSGETASKFRDGGVNTIDAANGVMTSALVTDKAVFFGSNTGMFYALDRFTGKEIWKVDTRSPEFPGGHPINIFNSSAILANGKIVVGGGGYEHPYPLDPSYPCCTGRGFVVAFDPQDGNVLWKYEVGEAPQEFLEPIAIEDGNGKHIFKFGPSTSSVWSTPSLDQASNTIFFGTDVHNSPRQPTDADPRLYTKYSAAIIALDVESGEEKWVTQLNSGDIYNSTMSGYDAKTKKYKDCSIGDTPKVLEATIDGTKQLVVAAGCKNGGFYLLNAASGKIVANTPVHSGLPSYPLKPKRDPRMIAVPSPIGGIQTGCATDGNSIFTNGIDWLTLNSHGAKSPEGGRVVSLTTNLAQENWRHERPKVRSFFSSSGDPVASGVALAGGLACFTTTVSNKLVVLNAKSGELLNEFDIGTVWSGPSISRGRIYVGTGSILFLAKSNYGTLYSFGLDGEDEVDRLGIGNE